MIVMVLCFDALGFHITTCNKKSLGLCLKCVDRLHEIINTLVPGNVICS